MDKIREILDEILEEDYTGVEDMVEAGIMDSLQVMELVDSLEENYGIEFSGRDIVPDNFSSIDKIVALLEKYGVEVND